MQEISSGVVAANDNDEYRFYVYAWQYPDGRTFYVGKGSGDRDTRPRRNKFFDNIISKIRREDGEPLVVRWQDGLREGDAFLLEKAYIKLLGRRNNSTGTLCNLTDGGEGPSGWIPSEETKSKIRAAKAGKPLSPEHKARIAAICSNPSEETRKKISDSLIGNKRALGLVHSEESRARMSVAHKGKKYALGYKHSEETRARMSASHTGISLGPHSDAAKEKMRSAKLGKKQKDEHRAKNSATKRMMPPIDGFKGVAFDGARNRWRAALKVSGKQINIGRFATPEEAARAYDGAAVDAWGLGNCYLNFPEEFELKESQ